MKKHFSKSRKALVILYSVIITIITLSAVWYHNRIEDVAFNQLEQQMQHINALRSGEINDLLTKYESVMAILGQQILETDPLIKDKDNLYHLLTTLVDQIDQIATISIADIDGQLQVVTGVDLDKSLLNLRDGRPDASSFLQSTTYNNSSIGRTYNVELLNVDHWVIPIRQNIDNEIIVAFGLAITNPSLYSSFLDFKETYVFRSDGYLQYTTDKSEPIEELYNTRYKNQCVDITQNALVIGESFINGNQLYRYVTHNNVFNLHIVVTAPLTALSDLTDGDINLLIMSYIIGIILISIIFSVVQTIIIDYEKQLGKQANHDSLTGLANRSRLLDELQSRLQHAKETNTEVAVFFIDLDDFKQVNDTYNHFVGDQLLIEVANRFVNILRKDDFVARLGGDEFVVIASNAENRRRIDLNTTRIAEQIHYATTNMIKVDDIELNSNSSIGIASYPENAKTATELLRKADLAMYQSKHQGKNQYVMYSPEIEIATLYDFELKAALRTALDNDEFSMVYQPQINVKTSKLIGFEALLRWNNDKFPEVTADKFIPILEQMKLMQKVGDFVLESSLSDFARYKKEAKCHACMNQSPPCKISINMSAVQFRQIDMVHKINLALSANNLKPNELEIELTESSLLMNDDEHVFIHELAQMGVSIAIDDFGTGYSSLKRLSALPINNIKIDKSFIDMIGLDYKVESLIKTILALGKKLDMTVVAEGVELPAQCEFLKTHHNNIIIQGYLFARPISIDKLLEDMQVQSADTQCLFTAPKID